MCEAYMMSKLGKKRYLFLNVQVAVISVLWLNPQHPSSLVPLGGHGSPVPLILSDVFPNCMCARLWDSNRVRKLCFLASFSQLLGLYSSH